MKVLKFLLVFMLVSCVKEKHKSEISTSLKQEISNVLEVFDFDGLYPLLNRKDNKVYVVNFWATWCAPCIKELPHFEVIGEKYTSKNVEVLLVSLDFPNQYEKKLKPYILQHKLKSKVVALNDTDMNTWIPKINEEWSGAIPATLIYNTEKREFYERSFTYSELEKEVKQFLKQR